MNKMKITFENEPNYPWLHTPKETMTTIREILQVLEHCKADCTLLCKKLGRPEQAGEFFDLITENLEFQRDAMWNRVQATRIPRTLEWISYTFIPTGDEVTVREGSAFEESYVRGVEHRDTFKVIKNNKAEGFPREPQSALGEIFRVEYQISWTRQTVEGVMSGWGFTETESSEKLEVVTMLQDRVSI